MIEVLDPGLLLTVQDAGRPGHAQLGVPPSGAADRCAYELGNRLVGNAAGAASLEATLAGPRLRFRESAVVAVTGAVETRVVELAAGEELAVGPYAGARAYVAVRGGIDVEPVLGSRSADLLSGLGPPPLRAGDLLRVGAAASADGSPEQVTDCYKLIRNPVLRVVPGPRADWLAPEALAALVSGNWRMSPSSNRVGIRLEGPVLAWASDEELLSEGVVTGALQVPRSGQPILLGPDHPTTGGYPVLAVVCADDLWLTGQLRPGDTVGFALA